MKSIPIKLLWCSIPVKWLQSSVAVVAHAYSFVVSDERRHGNLPTLTAAKKTSA
jgi:hypothetical protein